MADAVRAKGVDWIEGDIVGDDSALEDVPYPEGSSDEDMLWGYGAPASALTVHDNQVELTINDTQRSDVGLTMNIEPRLRYFDVVPLLGEKGHGRGVEAQDVGGNRVLIDRAPSSRTLHIEGYVAAKYGPFRAELAIDDPAKYAALALRDALERRNVEIEGGIKTRHNQSDFTGSFAEESRKVPDFPGLGCEASGGQAAGGRPAPAKTTLAEHVSPTLAEDLVLTMKDSQNLHAEMMLRNLSAGCHRTLISSLQQERRYLTRAGLSGDDFMFYDGSGLSVKDLVTPRATAQLLAFAATQPWFAQWKPALPVGGIDGTLANRFTAAPLKGHVFAKTGTLGESRALAGYLDAASGRTLIFSILVDNHTPGSNADRVVMDKIVAAIAAAN
jgi:D-alanyl-D-alanine carboxypeptidase/D-alanyl-D-alanine-endopeptidase (penicillin-binding protein 4)